jgi:hypothetical protein
VNIHGSKNAKSAYLSITNNYQVLPEDEDEFPSMMNLERPSEFRERFDKPDSSKIDSANGSAVLALPGSNFGSMNLISKRALVSRKLTSISKATSLMPSHRANVRLPSIHRKLTVNPMILREEIDNIRQSFVSTQESLTDPGGKPSHVRRPSSN